MSDWKLTPHDLPVRAKGGVAFFDLSTRTGWAYGFSGARPDCGVVHYADFADDGRTFAQHYDFMCDFIEHFEPSRLVMEAPLPATVVSNTSAWECQLGLAAITRLACRHYHRSCRMASVRTIRTAVLGSGFIPKNKAKGVVMEWCSLNGIDTPDHNAGDAAVGLEYALRTYHRKGFARDLAS